ncbi:oligosaccharide flippase family protein [Bacillus sp. IITD106]|nr:oligosaccharide flippase family protein [Bacillus sp. IITD106]
MNIIKKINNNRFLKNFVALFSATLAAQVITITASPVLTRIYTPEEFGNYSFYISVCTLLIVFVTGRYEFAINTVKTERESQILFRIVTTLSIIFTVSIFLIELILYDQIIIIFDLENVSSLMIFIPLTLLVMGIMQGLNYYLNKHKEFGVISKGKVIQSSINSGSSIFFGIGGLNSIGLILSNILGIVASIIYQTISKKLGKLFSIQRYNIRDMIKIASEHRQYPLYNSTSAFFDNLALQAPIFILMRFFSETMVGFYSLTIRVVGMPITLISTAVAQIFLSEVAELHTNNKSFKHVLKKVMKVLSLIGLLPVGFLIVAGPLTFRIIFGQEWEVAGELARILALGYYAKIVVMPLSVVFFVTNKVKVLSIIQVSRAFSTLLTLLLSVQSSNIYIVVIAYTVHDILFYCLYLFFIFKISK